MARKERYLVGLDVGTSKIAAIVSFGTLSRFTVLTSDAVASWMPDAGSAVWLPALGASSRP